MSSPEVTRRASSLTVEPTRSRQTPRPTVSFSNVVKSGGELLAAGARKATQIIGGPLATAAVAATEIATGQGVAGVPGISTGTPGIPGAAAGGQVSGEIGAMGATQDQRLGEDLQLLALQDNIQRNNRQVSLISNVMKARHETSKSAIGNIRS